MEKSEIVNRMIRCQTNCSVSTSCCLRKVPSVMSIQYRNTVSKFKYILIFFNKKKKTTTHKTSQICCCCCCLHGHVLDSVRISELLSGCKLKNNFLTFSIHVKQQKSKLCSMKTRRASLFLSARTFALFPCYILVLPSAMLSHLSPAARGPNCMWHFKCCNGCVTGLLLGKSEWRGHR